MTDTKTAPKLASKAEWALANDRGPHVAMLPTGCHVKFELADAGMLLRSGKLPEHVKATAQVAVSHEDGLEGYISDLVRFAVVNGGDVQAVVAAELQKGVELGHHLIAEMLVQPEVTADEVAAGKFHELDVRMLLEFAERRRDTDAAGTRLPIMLLDADQWARFRDGTDDAEGAADGGAGGPDVPGELPDADTGDV